MSFSMLHKYSSNKQNCTWDTYCNLYNNCKSYAIWDRGAWYRTDVKPYFITSPFPSTNMIKKFCSNCDLINTWASASFCDVTMTDCSHMVSKDTLLLQCIDHNGVGVCNLRGLWIFFTEQAPSHCLNQWFLIVNWTLGQKLSKCTGLYKLYQEITFESGKCVKCQPILMNMMKPHANNITKKY